MNPFTAVLDANVLYPAPLRDVFLCLAEVGLFRARWSEDIHREWTTNVLKNRPDLTEARLQQTRARMDRSIPGSLVTGYETLIPSLSLPDADDRHVLAAAICCHADLIVTFNLKDFPAEVLAEFRVEAQHPDVFLCHQLSLDLPKVLSALKTQREGLVNPQKKSLEFLATLERQQLPLFAAALRPFADVI